MKKLNMPTNRKTFPCFLTTILALLYMPESAQANTGVPMLYVIWPPLVLMLVPIILVETSYLSWALQISFRRLWKRVAIGNIISSFVGIPLVWVLWVYSLGWGKMDKAYGHLETLTGKLIAGVVQAPWLIPYESEFYWLIPLATVVLCCVFIVTSGVIESHFILRKGKKSELATLLPVPMTKEKTSLHILIAQVFSYIFIGVFLLYLSFGKNIQVLEKIGKILAIPIINFIYWIFS